jgi:hypothetical protein
VFQAPLKAGHVDWASESPNLWANYCCMRANVDHSVRSGPVPANFFKELVFSGSVSELQRRGLNTSAFNLPPNRT